jgi:hypothetical protein
VSNQGIGGNHLLTDGLGPAQFDRDVLAPSNVRWVIAFERMNDLGGLARNGETSPAEHAALRAPQHSVQLLPAYDCGDHLHPSSGGYKAMGTAGSLCTLNVAGTRIHIEDVNREGTNSVASCFGTGEPTCSHIAHRWLAKEAAVLPAELARTFIANLEGGARSIKTLIEHAFPGYVQTKLFLILQRAHRGE